MFYSINKAIFGSSLATRSRESGELRLFDLAVLCRMPFLGFVSLAGIKPATFHLTSPTYMQLSPVPQVEGTYKRHLKKSS